MFTNKEIDDILHVLKEYFIGDIEYVYSLYDTSYNNRPLNPKHIHIIVPCDIKTKLFKKIFHNYKVQKVYCYGIGEVLEITHK